MFTNLSRRWLRVLALGSLAFLLMTTSVPASVFQLNALAQSDDDATPMASPGASPATGSSGDTVEVSAVADTYVLSDAPDDNFGEEYRLITDEELYYSSYITFDVTGVTNAVERATVRFWVTNGTREAPTLWLAASVPWEEDEMTWNTRPALDMQVAEIEDGDAPEGEWLEYDVTSVVTGNGTYSFALVPESTDGMDVVSRQADENQPHMVLELTDEAASVDPVDPGEVPVLLAAGDIADCDVEQDELTAQILDDQRGTIAALGGTVYPSGSSEEFGRCYDPTWGRHRDRTLPTPGDHDYETEGAEAYFEYFGDAAGDPDEGYYSYDLGAWHIVVLNTNIDMSRGSDQEEWLREDLESNPATCTLAYAHHPLFSSGFHGNTPGVEPLYEALYENGVDVYLTSHDHNYERFAKQDHEGDADPEYGVRQFVVGTGGTPLRPFEDPQPNSEVRSADAHGVIRFELFADGYEWEFLGIEGTSFYDSGSDLCHEVQNESDGEEEDESGFLQDQAWLSTEPRRMTRSRVRRSL